MALVDYSDSDSSEAEERPTVKVASSLSKPAFQKVVDRSNPGKIKVSLPQASLKDDTHSDEPPTKRTKTGGGAFSGFNSFLPAPKRAGQINATLGGGAAMVKKGGLASGVNLKTSAAPGFSREPEPERYNDDDYSELVPANEGLGQGRPPPNEQQVVEQKSAEEVKLVGKPLMFKPLSVSRKPQKKKKTMPALVTTPNAAVANPSTPAPKAEKTQRPKVSLFSINTEKSRDFTPVTSGTYTPLMVEEVKENEKVEGLDPAGLEPTYEEYTPTVAHMNLPFAPTPPPASQSLEDVAGDLNLSAAERRQLFGRQKGGRGGHSATKVINFNTDQEYLHNEELRAAGEQVVLNPVRSIAPGKHSLKQLVNAAQSQKEALEESFAQGKNNRAEASSRYGW